MFKETDRIQAFPEKLWLSSPTMHGEEARYMMEAYETNWMSTLGKNIDEIEEEISKRVGVKHGVALSCGTTVLHLAIRLAGEALYGRREVHEGTLQGKTVLASDLTFDASVNPIAYENGKAVFVDSEYDTWNMDPRALERAFSLYPELA